MSRLSFHREYGPYPICVTLRIDGKDRSIFDLTTDTTDDEISRMIADRAGALGLPPAEQETIKIELIGARKACLRMHGFSTENIIDDEMM